MKGEVSFSSSQFCTATLHRMFRTMRQRPVIKHEGKLELILLMLSNHLDAKEPYSSPAREL